MRLNTPLNAADIRKLAPGKIYYETTLPGFGVRVSNGGVRSFITLTEFVARSASANLPSVGIPTGPLVQRVRRPVASGS